MRYDWLVVGAGFTGATLAERIASQLGQTVLLVDRRSHIAGNAYEESDDTGIQVHRYGPHIFHTNSRKVFHYLSRFTAWRPYEHRVLGVIDGQMVPIPFNLSSLHALFPAHAAQALQQRLAAAYGLEVKVPILRMLESPDPQLRQLAEFVYEKVFHYYTLKQWELRPQDLDAAVTGRVPIHLSWDDRYFQDDFQYMPADGYTAMFERMLSHPKITLALDTDFRQVSPSNFNRMVYTGPADEFFNHCHGALPYRSIRFEFVGKPLERFQPVGTVNYPGLEPFTRITEQKYLSGQTLPSTTLVYEYPEPYWPGHNEPYYPVPRPENRERYALYEREISKLKTVLFAGRLADYKYYNMDQACARALKLFEDEIAKL